jgi:hypothetical protein
MKKPYEYILPRMRRKVCRLCGHMFKPASGIQKTCPKCLRRTHPCKCGCGLPVCLTLNYVHGHNRRSEKSWKKQTKLCECGCGTVIPAFGARPSIPRRFVNGHNARNREIGRWLAQPGRLCACGCGTRIKRTLHQWKYGEARYVSGHNPPPQGKAHYAWKGGSSPLRPRVENHKVYLRWRRQVLKRDHYTCQKCGGKRNLEVAHILPFGEIVARVGPNLQAILDFHTADVGITLCRECHRGKAKS